MPVTREDASPEEGPSFSVFVMKYKKKIPMECQRKLSYYSPLVTREDVSTEEESSVTVSDFKIKNEKSDEVSKDTENIFVDVEIEQNSNSPKDGSTSNDEVVDYSQHTSMKKEPDVEFQQTDTGLEVLSMTREDASPEEGPSFSVFGYEIQKENSNGMSKETENILVDVEIGQSSDGSTSKFSDSNDEVVDYSQHTSMKNEPSHEFQQTNTGLEVLSMTREDASPEEGPSFSVFGYEIQKENSNGMSKETEQTILL
ncbi:uncharacterized protein LOC143241692 [Tachypleus tridentatus]|uniref:uncharacterized protein LOC143241692 n=1 Tax=Tachypleus tridentatus TaxID=6853 RepID=UPI003FD4D561